MSDNIICFSDTSALVSDSAKSVVLQQPVAGIKTGDGDFLGSLARMGHGLQKSYLLALLQELASSEAPDAPTLILGCEEPELYQHPPQARHLADVFSELSTGNNQILVTIQLSPNHGRGYSVNLRIPVHREHSFRFNVNADSGHREHRFWSW